MAGSEILALRASADSMHREEQPVFDAVADLLDAVLVCTDGHPTPRDEPVSIPFGAFVDVAEAYLRDPGDLPAAITGGAQ